MSEIINITPAEQRLQAQVQALQFQHDELLHENNLVRARNVRLDRELNERAIHCAKQTELFFASQTHGEKLQSELELERNTAHALSEQLESVRAAGKLAIDALESGLEAAGEVQNDTHVKYAGYKPELHKHVDDEVAKICAAIEAMKAGGAA